jgi:hypothetical protein
MIKDLKELPIMRKLGNIRKTQMVEATEVSHATIFRHQLKTTPTPITKQRTETS